MNGTHREKFLKANGLEDKSYSIKELSGISKVPVSILKKVYSRGVGAYKTQPNSVRLKGSYVKNVKAPMSAKLSKEQWGMARVYSFLNGNPKHDEDLRKNKLKGGATVYERGIASYLREKFYFPEGSEIYPIYQYLSAVVHSPNTAVMPDHPYKVLLNGSEPEAEKAYHNLLKDLGLSNLFQYNKVWGKPPRGNAVVPTVKPASAPPPPPASPPPPSPPPPKAGLRVLEEDEDVEQSPASPAPAPAPKSKVKPKKKTKAEQEREDEEAMASAMTDVEADKIKLFEEAYKEGNKVLPDDSDTIAQATREWDKAQSDIEGLLKKRKEFEKELKTAEETNDTEGASNMRREIKRIDIEGKLTAQLANKIMGQLDKEKRYNEIQKIMLDKKWQNDYNKWAQKKEMSGKGKVSMSKKQFVKEHKNLLGVLKRGKKSELRAEAKDQSEELEKVLKGAGIFDWLFKKKAKVAPEPRAPPPTEEEKEARRKQKREGTQRAMELINRENELRRIAPEMKRLNDEMMKAQAEIDELQRNIEGVELQNQWDNRPTAKGADINKVNRQFADKVRRSQRKIEQYQDVISDIRGQIQRLRGYGNCATKSSTSVSPEPPALLDARSDEEIVALFKELYENASQEEIYADVLEAVVELWEHIGSGLDFFKKNYTRQTEKWLIRIIKQKIMIGRQFLKYAKGQAKEEVESFLRSASNILDTLTDCQNPTNEEDELPEVRGSGLWDTMKDIVNPDKIKNEFLNPDSVLRRRVADVSKGVRLDYPPSARKTLQKYGEKKILSLTLRRDPVGSAINNAFNILSAGTWSKAKKAENFDRLFHLGLLATLEGNTQILIEKNEVIYIGNPKPRQPDTETLNIPAPSDTTLLSFLQRAEDAQGEAFFRYDPFKFNCQDFVSGLLGANGVLTTKAKQFIKQDVDALVSKLPSYVAPVARAITDLGALVNVAVEGAGKQSAERATRGNPKFEAQLKKEGIEPSAYLEEAKRRAKEHHYPYKLLGFATDGKHKLAIPDENGRVLAFGRVGYGDHIIYSHLEKAGKVPPGTAKKKQNVFQKSHSKIKGDWKSNPFSPNNLALKILW